jgi:hypothetical protein
MTSQMFDNHANFRNAEALTPLGHPQSRTVEPKSQQAPQAEALAFPNLSTHALVQAYIERYNATGKCDYPPLVEIAQLAWKRQLLFPAQIQIFFKELDQIDAAIQSTISAMAHHLEPLMVARKQGESLSMKVMLEFANHAALLTQPVSQLMAIAESNITGQTNSLLAEKASLALKASLKGMSQLQQTMRLFHTTLYAESSEKTFHEQSFVPLYLLPVKESLEELRLSTASLGSLLRQIILSKLPSHCQ